MTRNTAGRLLPLLLLPLASACADVVGPTGMPSSAPLPRGPVQALDCTASVRGRSVTCATPRVDGGHALLLGGQDVYVKLVSSNVQVFADTFAFDATVQNLIPQPLGTTDTDTTGGLEPDPAGVRVFFAQGPVSTSSGSIGVANPDGLGTFTGANQPYFQYGEVLPQNVTSAARTWKLRFSPEVTAFTFRVYVSAAVPYPDGYVDGLPRLLVLDPSESRTLLPVVRDVLGQAQAGEPVDYTVGDPGIVTVNTATGQTTAGPSRGATTIAVQSGARPGVPTVHAAVCPATVVGNGTDLPASIATSDCWSVANPKEGYLPGTAFYGDVYRVTLAAGQTVTITTNTGDVLDTQAVLMDANGNVVAENDDDDTGVLGVGSRIEYTAAAAGVYVIQVTTFSEADTGSYAFHVGIT